MKLDNVFGIHEQALKLRSRRAELLAGNLANADTPGFKARDFDFRQALKGEMARPVTLEKTHRNHISTTAAAGSSPFRLLYRVPGQPSLDGNTVDTQLEKSAFSVNAMEYQASLRFLGGKIEGLKRAIRGE